MIVSTPFHHAVGSQLVTERTEFTITKEPLGLSFIFCCRDDKFVAFNKFYKDNEPLWQQEVLEVFIAVGDQIPSRYIEFQINPNNAVFLANIVNPDGKGLCNELQMLNPSDFQLQNKVVICPDDNSWHGSFFLPFELLNGVSNVFRANVYRIIRTSPLENSEWRCNPQNSVFACWHPINNAVKPAFHQPSSFALLTL